MKKANGCRVGRLVLGGWLLLSLIGYIGKDSIYAQYTLDWRTTPYFQLVFQGIQDGIYPWSKDAAGNFLFAAGDRNAEDGILDTPEAEGKEGAPTDASEAAQETPESLSGTENTESAGAAKAFVQTDRAYFDDAVFIGDSRTVGLMEYGGLDQAAFYATVGMNVYDLWEKEFCEADGEKVTLEQALSSRQFGKVYFQIGINEMGRGTVDSFLEAYADSIQRFRQLQPDALIFIQGIMRVSKEKSESDAIFNNRGIDERNMRIAQLADNVHVFYVDVNEIVSDAEGNLNADLTSDGLHLYAAEYEKWVEYLMTKGIERES